MAASGTSVAVSAQPPDNCWQIQVTNPSSTADGLIGQATAPAPLTAGVNASRIPAGTTRVFSIGTIQDRGTVTNLVADSIGGAVALEITYVNAIGSI